MGDTLQSSGGMLYHGTGFLAHEHTGSVYEGKPTGRTKQVVKDIMTNGLVPFHDPLNPDGGSSTSLTHDPLYALLYALCYSEKGTSMNYVSHRGKLWCIIFRKMFEQRMKVGKVLAANNCIAPSPFQKHNTLGKAWRWSHTFNDVDYNSLLLAPQALVYGESNIHGNFPVVFGLKSSFDLVIHGWLEIRKREVTPPDQIDTVYVPEKLIHLFQNYPQNIVPIEQLIETITSGKQEEYMRHEYPAQLVEKMRTGGVVSYDDYYPLLFQRGKSAPIEHIKSFLRHGNWGSEGAGLLIKSSNQVLLLRRSKYSTGGKGQLGLPGGAAKYYRDTGKPEHSLVNVVTQVIDELRYLPRGVLTGVDKFSKPGFEYSTFIMDITEEEKKKIIDNIGLNWEHVGFEWVELNDIKSGKRTDIFGPVVSLIKQM